MEILTKIDTYKLRGMCIERNFYTKGTNEEYGEMFEMARNNWKPVDAKLIYRVAKDIKEHSETEETVESIAYDILNEATVHLLL